VVAAGNASWASEVLISSTRSWNLLRCCCENHTPTPAFCHCPMLRSANTAATAVRSWPCISFRLCSSRLSSSM
jgi:hypothetical protein